MKYAVLRPWISWFAYYLRYKNRITSKFKTKSGAPLKNGITYCCIAKDETYAIDACLNSIIGFADQLIAIDNGSKDDTFIKMLEFKKRNKDTMDIIVLQCPGLTLSECRQVSMEYVDRTWFFRGDGDFILTDNFTNLKKTVLKYKRPASISLQLIDLFGDEHHGSKYLSFIRQGEYYLRMLENDIQYEELYGRVEHANIPIYHRLEYNRKVGLLHLNCNKSNERIFFRTCNLDFRQYVNEHGSSMEFSTYQKLWLEHVFKTADPQLIEYRMARLVAEMCIRISPDYKHEMAKVGQSGFHAPFVVLYRNGKPFFRVGANEVSKFSEEYISMYENPAWIPDADEYHKDSQRKKFIS